MRGMSGDHGGELDGREHLFQSIRDILTTPVGSRVMRRDYGSRLSELIDSPTAQGLEVDIFAACAEALAKWEPRFELKRIELEHITPGHISMAIIGLEKDSGEIITVGIAL